MKLKKWSTSSHQYIQQEIPDEWNCKMYSNNMKEIVNCPHCGKELEFGQTFTSLEFHNFLGLGYGVCKSCYEKEWERKNNDIYRE